jgi:hypothetical protein
MGKRKALDMEMIEGEIEKLPESNKGILLTEVMSDLCPEILDEACRDQLKELFGIDCLEKLEKRLKTGV